MFTIRTLSLWLVAIAFLVPNFAIAQEGNDSDKKSIIGIVGFGGKDGAQITTALSDAITKKAFVHGSVIKIQVIDRSTFDAEVRQFGSEEKATKALAEKHGFALISFGTANVEIVSKPVDWGEKKCTEARGFLEIKINIFIIRGRKNSYVENVEDEDGYIICRGIVQARSPRFVLGRDFIPNIFSDFQNYSGAVLKRKLIKAAIRKMLDRLSDIQIDEMERVGSKYDTQISGNTRINASASNVTTTSVNNSDANTQIGSISGARINGSTTINASVGGSVHVAGSNSCATTTVGSISSSPCDGDPVTSIAIGDNSHSAASQGVIGKPRDGRGGGSASQSASYRGMAEPPFFPWPPPAPSLFGEVTSNFRIVADLATINAQISSLLQHQGYDSLHYFGVDGGFVVTTDLERIESDGKSAAKDRWLIGKAGHPNSFSEYIGNLIFGEKGRFRLFAFIVGNHEPSAAPFPATEQDTQRWKVTGAITLSAQTGARRVESGTRVWLYVYEFESSLEKSVTIVPLADHAVSFAAHKHSLGLR